jgi:dipeptidase
MSDTIVVVRPDGVLFAKNSDRDPNEAQIPEWRPRTQHPAETTVECTHIEIPQVAQTWATLISRPFWMWGAEMGSNEHGVTIGNEAVFTDQRYAATGLTGMDLVRLALERASSAAEAVDVIVDLIEDHGQGGGCGHEDPSFTYHNSFLVADPIEAWVLETAGSLWAAEQVTSGVRTISNGLTIPGFAEEHRDGLRSRVSACDARTMLTTRAASNASEPGDLMTLLRSHGEQTWPRYRALNGTLSAPCMHGGGVVASSSSVAGWVSDLRTEQHWITATAAQCLALFKPVTVSKAVDIGTDPTDDGTIPLDASADSLWWRHERMARKVMRDPERLAPLFLRDRDEVEQRWLVDPPEGQSAFNEGSELLHHWSNRVAGAPDPVDVRPRWARRYWAKRNTMAGISSPEGV